MKKLVAIAVFSMLQLVLSSCLLAAGTCTYTRSSGGSMPKGRYEVTWVCTADTSGNGPAACTDVTKATGAPDGIGVCEGHYGTIKRVIIDPGTAPDASWDAELRLVINGTIDATVDLLNNLGDDLSATNTKFDFPLTPNGGVVMLYGDGLIPYAASMGTDGDETFTMRILIDNSQ